MYLKTVFKIGMVGAALLLSACNNGQAPTPDEADAAGTPDVFESSLIESGREIAERNCAGCHSIEREGESPLLAAPPLRTALANFDIEALAIDFREHISLGNGVMPEFDFSPLHTDALMAYLLSIEVVETGD